MTLPLQLSLKLDCNAAGKTNVSHRYMAYPLSISPIFRLEENSAESSTHRAYLYRMNTSPGLLAGDQIGMSLQLAQGAQLYLADQSATKVHPMPTGQAGVNYRFEVGDRATLEFLPEPLILFTDSTLTQTTEVIMHSTASLSLGEIILPGRIARGEVYQFHQYLNRLRVSSPAGQVWFAETMKLLGKSNRFAQSALFASGAVLGSLVLILPEEVSSAERLAALSTEIDSLVEADGSVDLASSILPDGRGLFVRAIAQTTREIQTCFKGAVNCVRRLRGQSPLPYSV
jgi:urease accessory protein